jgi:hypothetical protein
MQLPPASVILSWPTPNYVDPTDVRGPELLIIILIFLPIALILVALRIYTRLRLSRSFGVDDVSVLAAAIPATACAALFPYVVRHLGWDHHIWDVPIDLLSPGLQMSIVLASLFVVAVSCTKVSLLILIRRLMLAGTGILYHVTTASIILVACEAFVFIVVVIFTCR